MRKKSHIYPESSCSTFKNQRKCHFCDFRWSSFPCFQTSAPPSFILYLYWTMISLSVISLGKSPFQITNNLVIRTKWVLPPSSAAHVRLLPSTIHFRISSFPLKWLHLLFIRHNLFPRNSSNPARGEVGRQSHSCNTVRYVLWYADRRGSVYRWAII